jgi:hypothetical protein
MRIRTLAGPPLEHEIVRDVLRSILLTNDSVTTDIHGDIDADANATVVPGVPRQRRALPST